MTTGGEQGILARAQSLAESVSDLSDQTIEVICRARAARVDQQALRGLVGAVRLLDGSDPGHSVPRMLAGVLAARRRGDGFRQDTEMLAAIGDLQAELDDRAREAGELRRLAAGAATRAGQDQEAAGSEHAAAQRMYTTHPCRGCHQRRDAAVNAARDKLAGARSREDLAGEALSILAPLRLDDALKAVSQVPGDYEEVYEAVLELVRRDPDAMPDDGGFITGEAGSRRLCRPAAGDGGAPGRPQAERVSAKPAGSLGCPRFHQGEPHHGHNIWGHDGTSGGWRHAWCPGSTAECPGSTTDDAAIVQGPDEEMPPEVAADSQARLRLNLHPDVSWRNGDPAVPDIPPEHDDLAPPGPTVPGSQTADAAGGSPSHDAAEAAQAAPAPGAETDGACPRGQAPETGPAFDAAEADSQMHAAIGRNDGWRFEMISPHNGADGHRYRYTSYGRHTGTIEVTAEGFRWETASHLDGSPLASGTTTAIAEAFRAVMSGEPAVACTGTRARAGTTARLASYSAQLTEGWKRRAEQRGYLRAAYGVDPDKVSYRALAGRPGEVAVQLSQAQEHLLNRRFAAMDGQLAAAMDYLAGCPGARGARVRRSVTELRERLQARLGKPKVIGLADGQTRQVTRRWPDGSWTCPWCESPAMAGEAPAQWSRGCPNPGCLVNMPADRLAAWKEQQDAGQREREHQASIARFTERMAGESRQSGEKLWAGLEARASAKGACLRCLLESDWRSGRAKLVRHRSDDYHGPATTAREAE